ncbi:MAG: GNAT family N-acetyltransferase, partial [Chitinispirillaceae bacterium]
MIIIRRIEDGEYSLLPKIEDMAGEIFLQAGIDLSHFSSTPSTYYESFDKERSGIFVAVKEGEIIGFCYTKTVDNNGYLGEMSVIPQYTRQGIGTKLLHKAIDWTREKNYRFLLLTTF